MKFAEKLDSQHSFYWKKVTMGGDGCIDELDCDFTICMCVSNHHAVYLK